MKYRLGTHNKQLVYLQDLDEATKQDEMIAVFFDAADAALFVEVLNQHIVSDE